MSKHQQMFFATGKTAVLPSAPPGVTGLIGWWDASLPASITYNTGVNVQTWADQSGSGHTLSYGSNIYGRPTYSATGFNSSLPAVMVTTLVGSALQNASFAMGTGNTLTFFYVTNLTAAQSNTSARLFSYVGPGATDDYNDTRSWTVSAYGTDKEQQTITRNYPTSAQTPRACSSGVNHRIIGTIDSSGVMKLYVDGVPATLATAAGNWTSPGTLQLGRVLSSNNGYWGGPIAECGIATGFSDATAVGLLDNYLKAKWGFSPPVTGLIGWWDASVAGSFGLTGALINTWADQSGLGNTLSWAGYNRLSYSATGMNSRPAVVFGSSQTVAGSLKSAATFPMGTGNTLTAFYVGLCQAIYGANQHGRSLSYAGTGQTADWNNVPSWACHRYGGSDTALRMTRNSVEPGIATQTSAAIHRVIYTVNSSGITTIYVDGVAAVGSTAVVGNWTSPGTFVIGAGAEPANVGFWEGSIAEAGVATGFSDATAAAALDTYLKNKWGL